jgi:hypothetical protein
MLINQNVCNTRLSKLNTCWLAINWSHNIVSRTPGVVGNGNDATFHVLHDYDSKMLIPHCVESRNGSRELLLHVFEGTVDMELNVILNAIAQIMN